ncbi:tetratricopeptide repeat protein [Numidum massiliense]|uniref:tetratricopeptide repeat protein n=1 Tax=Numidum massiliense TaxID=1522315 RepID=UPI0006D58516|nr:tetratricopeptide repeat protein [Numidum massiliense]
MSIERIELGNIIRKKRKELGLTLNDLAGDNISVPTISNIERGITHNVSDEKITYLLDQLGLDEQTIAKMKQSGAVEKEHVELELVNIAHLVELKLFDLARERIMALEKQDIIDENAHFSAHLQLTKANLYLYRQHWDRTERILKKVVRLVKECAIDAKTNIEAEAYYLWGQIVFYRDQDTEQALRYSDWALDAFHLGGDKPYLEGRINYNIGVYHYRAEAYAPALKYISKAKKISEQTNDMRTLAMTFYMEGNILKKQEMYQEAIPFFKKAINVSRTLYPNNDLACHLYINMGDNYYCAEQYEEAIRYYKIVRELCHVTKDQQMMAHVYRSYGEVYLATGDYDRAALCADKALDLMKKVPSPFDRFRLLLLCANTALCQKSEKTVDYCQEGIRLADELKQYRMKKEFHFLLAKYYSGVGNNEKHLRELQHLFYVETVLNKEAR